MDDGVDALGGGEDGGTEGGIGDLNQGGDGFGRDALERASLTKDGVEGVGAHLRRGSEEVANPIGVAYATRRLVQPAARPVRISGIWPRHVVTPSERRKQKTVRRTGQAGKAGRIRRHVFRGIVFGPSSESAAGDKPPPYSKRKGERPKRGAGINVGSRSEPLALQKNEKQRRTKGHLRSFAQKTRSE